jgi:hypothetical protein
VINQDEDTNYLVEEHTYLMKMELYDVNNRKITITDNLVFASESDLSKIEILKRNKGGSIMVFSTKALL